VRLIDGEFGPMPLGAIVTEAVSRLPEAVLFGHSSSTSGHPVIAEAAHAIAKVRMVWAACSDTSLARDSHRRGVRQRHRPRRGQETARRLMSALETSA